MLGLNARVFLDGNGILLFVWITEMVNLGRGMEWCIVFLKAKKEGKIASMGLIRLKKCLIYL